MNNKLEQQKKTSSYVEKHMVDVQDFINKNNLQDTIKLNPIYSSADTKYNPAGKIYRDGAKMFVNDQMAEVMIEIGTDTQKYE